MILKLLRAMLPLSAFMLFSGITIAGGQLQKPSGEVILEIRGNIGISNVDGEAHFDREMIEALEQHTIKTSNHVVSQVTRYDGPRLYDLLTKLDTKGTTVNVIAWDDYVSQLKMADIQKYQVLLATHENNKQMTLDDRGPFFIVFPFSEHPEIQKDLYYNMSVWQIKAIEIE